MVARCRCEAGRGCEAPLHYEALRPCRVVVLARSAAGRSGADGATRVYERRVGARSRAPTVPAHRVNYVNCPEHSSLRIRANAMRGI